MEADTEKRTVVGLGEVPADGWRCYYLDHDGIPLPAVVENVATPVQIDLTVEHVVDRERMRRLSVPYYRAAPGKDGRVWCHTFEIDVALAVIAARRERRA